jgi:hypothetical protein
MEYVCRAGEGGRQTAAALSLHHGCRGRSRAGERLFRVIRVQKRMVSPAWVERLRPRLSRRPGLRVPGCSWTGTSPDVEPGELVSRHLGASFAPLTSTMSSQSVRNRSAPPARAPPYAGPVLGTRCRTPAAAAPPALSKSSCVNHRHARKSATSLAAGHTRPSLIFIWIPNDRLCQPTDSFPANRHFRPRRFVRTSSRTDESGPARWVLARDRRLARLPACPYAGGVG